MNRPTAQDRHLDLLLSLALEQLEQEEDGRLAQSGDPNLAAGDALRADRAFEDARRTVGREQRRARRIRRAKRAAHSLKVIAAAAAVVVLAQAAALPLAFRASAEFRSFLMTKLVVQLTGGEYSLSITLRPEEGSAVPPPDTETPPLEDLWNGAYLPQYIPEGFLPLPYDGLETRVVYEDNGGGRFTYEENEGPMPPVEVPAGAFYILEYLHGGDFPVIEEQTGSVLRVTVTWEEGGRWFRLTAENMDREEALRIADSVAPVAWADTAFYSFDASNPALAASGVPDWWRGDSWPAAQPEDMEITSFVISGNRVTMTGPEGKTILYEERRADDASALTAVFYTEGDTRAVDIQGSEGLLTCVDLGGETDALLIWQRGEVCFELYTTGFTAEEAVALAESVTECPKQSGAGGISLPRDAQGNTLAPREWSGSLFPAYVPEGFSMNSMEVSPSVFSMTLTGTEMSPRVTLRETCMFTPAFPDLTQAAEARIVQIGGRNALLLRVAEATEDKEMLYWQFSDFLWAELETVGLPEETLLQIAESIRETGNSTFGEP